jgi:hypothetical protein
MSGISGDRCLDFECGASIVRDPCRGRGLGAVACPVVSRFARDHRLPYVKIGSPCGVNQRDASFRAEHDVNVQAGVCRRHGEHGTRPHPGSGVGRRRMSGGLALRARPPATVRVAIRRRSCVDSNAARARNAANKNAAGNRRRFELNRVVRLSPLCVCAGAGGRPALVRRGLGLWRGRRGRVCVRSGCSRRWRRRGRS